MELTYFHKGIGVLGVQTKITKVVPPPPMELTYFQKGIGVLGVQTKITKDVHPPPPSYTPPTPPPPPPDGAYLFSEGDWCAWCANKITKVVPLMELAKRSTRCRFNVSSNTCISSKPCPKHVQHFKVQHLPS